MPTVTSTLQINLVDDVSANAKHVAAALEAAQKQTLALEAALAKSGTSDKLQGNLKKIGASASHVEGVTLAWKDFAKQQGIAGKATSDWTKAQVASVKSWESVTVSAVRAVKSEEASLARLRGEQAAQAIRDAEREAQGRIAAMQRETRAARQEALQRQEAMSRGGIGHYAAGAVAGYVSAHGVIQAAERTMKAGETLEHALAMMKITGVKQEEINRVLAAARAASKAVPTSTDAENISMVVETKNAFGKVDEALENLQFLAKTTSILKDVSGDKIGASKEQMGYYFTKFFEARGVATNSKVFQEEGNEMNRAMIATRGVFNPMEMYNFSSQAGAKDALRKYSPRFMERILPSIITAQSGATAGTSATAYDRIISGSKISNKQQAEDWKSLHLFKPGHAPHEGRGGQLSWRPGDIIGTRDNPNAAYSDPDTFQQQVVLPAMRKYWHVNTNDPLAVQNAMKRLYVNPKALGFATEFTNPGDRTRITNDAANYGEANGTDEAYRTLLSKNPETGIDAVKSSFENLKATMSAPVWEAFGGVWKDIAGYANQITDSAKAHPAAAGSAFVGGTAAGLLGSGFASWWAYKKVSGLFRGDGTVKGADAPAAEASGTTSPGLAERLKAGAGAELGSLAGMLGLVPLLSYWLSQGDSMKLKPEQIEAMKKEMREHPENYRFVPKAGGGVQMKEGGSAPEDRSLWHRVFGAADTGVVPVSFSNDSTSMSAFERAVSRGVSDGMMAFASRYSSGQGGGGGGDGGVIKANYRGGSHNDGGYSDIGQGHGGGAGGGGRSHFMSRMHPAVRKAIERGSRHAGKAKSAAQENIALNGSSLKRATDFVKRKEGYIDHAKWDVNHYRLGYGSDTMTDADGRVHSVQPGDHTTRADAERDLARRIPIFQKGLANEVGVAHWNALSPDAQAALTSVGYNYGSFKKLRSLRAAIATEDPAKISAAVAALQNHNGGINRKRRLEEAGLIAHGGRAVASEPTNDPLGLKKKPIRSDLLNELQRVNGLAVSPDFNHDGVHKFTQAVRTARAELEALHGTRAGGTGGPSNRTAGLGSRLRGGFASAGSDFG